jgi:hypothetical protein
VTENRRYLLAWVLRLRTNRQIPRNAKGKISAIAFSKRVSVLVPSRPNQARMAQKMRNCGRLIFWEQRPFKEMLEGLHSLGLSMFQISEEGG